VVEKMTYLLLTVTVMALVAIYAFLMRHWLVAKHLVGTAAVMLTLTAIFDNVIIGTGIVAYDAEKISGIKIGVAPIEDFAYTVLAIVLVPSLFNFFRTKL
jgi:lycopene cyclase domain-containing protein